MHSRVDFHMDKVASSRFSKAQRDTALNVAQDKFINVFIDTFQLDQYTRDAMRPLVKPASSVVLVGNVITYPADYRAMVGITLTIDGLVRYLTREMLYNEKGPSFDSSFEEPTAEYPKVIEDATGLRVYCGTGVVTAASMDYIVQPTEILYSSTAITQGANVLTVGNTYYVTATTVTHNAVSYVVGDTFVAVNTMMLGTGTVYQIRNCQLGIGCHEELCKVAAAVLSGITEDQLRFQIKSMEGKR